jgi:rhodanese-related sulfurtransferase
MKMPWWMPFGRVPGVAAVDLAEAVRGKTGLQLLDVRSPSEFAADHIAGAVNVPITELAERIPTLSFDRSRPVVAICLSAHRSIPAVRLLTRAGFTDVRQLDGGMLAYRRIARRGTE